MAGRPGAPAHHQALSYGALRRAHVGATLRALVRRRQAALVAAAAFLGPLALALLEPAARAMVAATAATAPFAGRLAFIATWIAASTLLVLALREAVFMQSARPFLRALPIARGEHWRGDAAAIAIAYGLLWLQLGYAAVRIPMLAPAQDAPVAYVAIGGAVALGIVAQTLLFQARPGEWIGVVATAAAMWAMGTGPAGTIAATSAAIALVAWYAALRYERARFFCPGTARVNRRMPGPAHMAVATLRHECGEAAALRVGAAAAIVAGGAALGAWGGFCGKAWGVGVAQIAACGLLLHRFPAMVHESLVARFAFLYRLRRLRRRAIAAVFGVSLAAFTTSALAAAGSWRLACGALDAARWRESFMLFAVAFAVTSLAAPRLGTAASWIAAVAFGAVALGLAMAA